MFKYFLGDSPKWYKYTIIAFLLFNILSVFTLGSQITAWLFIGEFIFTLAMALRCYPLQSGGLLAIEVLVLKLTHPMYKMEHGHIVRDEHGHGVIGGVWAEIVSNLEVIMLLVFMVAAIYFMKPLLMYIFSKTFTKIKSKIGLSMLFVFLGAFLSAFLDALTVTAVFISVAVGFYEVYHKIHSGNTDYDDGGVLDKKELSGETLDQFRSFLRSLVMHGVVGTALGGVMTLVGEPQNLLIGAKMGWSFVDFFHYSHFVTVPTFFAGIFTTFVLEKFKLFDFGAELPPIVRKILENYTEKEDNQRTDKDKYGLIVQGLAGTCLIIGLALHLAPVGLIGLALIILQTAFMGIIDEHQLGAAFEEALPFTGLIVVFFVIVAMIHDQHLFAPIIHYVLDMDLDKQPAMFYLANGVLSAISDNVFVATVYINEVLSAYHAGEITRGHLETLAVAINTGTNLPSVATPNGQAALLFLLTSTLAPLIELSYLKMVKMALPYTIVLTIVGLLGVMFLLPEFAI